METSIKQMVKIAQAIQEQLQSLQAHRIREVHRLTYVVCTNLEQLQTGRKYLEHCASRGWHGAATRLTSKLECKLRDIPYSVEQAIQMIASVKTKPASFRQIVEELTQLQDEFGSVEYNLQERTFSVFTDPIELEDIYLGDFEIRLDVEKLAQLRDSSAFQVIAQEPHPAASNDDEAVSVFFEDQVDLGRKPEQFFRLWCHTHPGDSPDPSSIDEETFARVFGRCDWAVMVRRVTA